MSNAIQDAERMLRLPQVMAMTGLGRSSIYALAQNSRFPKPIKLSERISAWPESHVRAWIAERIAAAESTRPAKAAA
jgi:prophage regulatory protein